MKTQNRKAVMVTFENHSFRNQQQLVIGTIDVRRAIMAVKCDQAGRRVEIKATQVYKNVDLDSIGFDLDHAITL